MNSRYTIYFIITRKCNYSCYFCIRDNLILANQDVSYENFVHAIDILSAVYSDYNLVLTGGEPFLNSRFYEMLAYASKKASTVTITSNGSFGVNESINLKPFLKQNVYLQLSIDGPQKIHDKIRGNGAYAAVLRNLRALKDCSEHLIISTTIGLSNMKYVGQLAIALNQYSFRHWKVSPAQIQSPLNVTEDISSEEWNKLVDIILPLCYFRVHIKKMFDFDLFNKYSKTNIKMDCIYNCGFGKRKFYITTNFDILPCSCVKENVGNLFKDKIEVISERLTTIGTIVPDENSICVKCEYLKHCNGGCPGYSMKCFGVYNMGDIRCPKVREGYEKY